MDDDDSDLSDICITYNEDDEDDNAVTVICSSYLFKRIIILYKLLFNVYAV